MKTNANNAGKCGRSLFDNENEPDVDIKPFYMWAGGKTRLLKHYRPIIDGVLAANPDVDGYVEPFFGGGAVYCMMHNDYSDIMRSYAINDVNAELMGLLRTVKSDDVGMFLDECHELASRMLALDGKAERKEWYYNLRGQYWHDYADMDACQRSAMLFILMRTGFNGIWQSCKDANGLFATPAGLLNQSSSKQLFTDANIMNWHDALQDTAISCGSYEHAPMPASGGRSLVYLDPPYRHSFTSYGTGFSDDDQRRLCEWMNAMHADGNIILMSNRTEDDDRFFHDLLPDAVFHDFDIVYTAGRRKRTETGFEAKPAHEFLCVLS